MDLRLKTCIFLSRLNGTHWEHTLQIICKYSQDLVRHSSHYASEDRYHKYDCILIFEVNLANILAKFLVRRVSFRDAFPANLRWLA